MPPQSEVPVCHAAVSADPPSPAGEALRDFHLRSHRAMDRLLSAHGSSLAKVKLMMFIGQRGSVRSADIVESFGFAPRTITEAIDALERDALVERVADPDDRRAKRISLTDAGCAMLETTVPPMRKFGRELLSVLSETETKQLTRLMGKLNTRLDELMAARQAEGE
ncbi:MarR family transcriptional regulator [soil metagenome]